MPAYLRLVNGCSSFQGSSDRSGSGNDDAIDMNVHPNPGQDFVFVSYEGIQEGPATLELISANGQTMQLIPIDALEEVREWRLNTSGLPAGFYFIRLKNAGGMKYKTWFKE